MVRPIEDDETEKEETKTDLYPQSASSARRLVAFWPDGTIVVELPTEGVLTIGRGRASDIRIDHPSISRQHARIRIGATITIEDLGSANGVSFGPSLVVPRIPVRIDAGSIIGLGAAVIVLQGMDPISSENAPTEWNPTHALTPMDRLNQLVELVAKSTISVLLRGETGVGKEVTAARVHELSPRGAQPLVKLNCAALPDTLLESELFGYERGAFTGAVQTKKGLLEAGDGGTVFLDEVGDMPPTTQAKLLRAIESREVLRVGALKPRPVDVRFVAATNRDLEQLVTGGQFRADLYFRLNGITIVIPPLRERRNEIPRYVQQFVRESCYLAGRPPLAVASATFKQLESYAWPGNIRELRNVVDRAVVLCTGETIQPEHVILGDGALGMSGRLRLDRATDPESQRQAIKRALDQCNGNQTQAAELLGISRRTLLYRLDAYDLPRPRKR